MTRRPPPLCPRCGEACHLCRVVSTRPHWAEQSLRRLIASGRLYLKLIRKERKPT